MRQYRSKCISVALMAMFLAAPAAFAADNVGRCAADWISSNAVADGRIQWALNNGYISAQQAWDMKNYFDIATGTVRQRTYYNYPLFGWLYPDIFNTVVWVAPTSPTASSWRPFQYGSYASFITACPVGCYTPEQQVRFPEGYKPIKEALEAGTPEVVTLSKQATMDQLAFQNTKVAAYVADVADADQVVFRITTASRGELRITPTHPLVDGTGVVRKAETMAVGDELVREDGSLDPIVSIEKEQIFGRVYNIRPATTDSVTNIVVAQGFLNGSMRYQDETLSDNNRSLTRSNLPAALFE